MRGQGQRAGVQDALPQRRSWARELAVRLEDRADKMERAMGEGDAILVLRALGECLRELEKLDERTSVIEQQQNVIMRRGERHG